MRFNTAEYAEYYHKQMVEAGYPGKLLPFILEQLKDFFSVLDIGAGTGFYLAESGHSVTAVEPSAEMLDMMKKNADTETLALIKICNTTCENWKGEVHDAAICIHSLYPMPDIKKAITLIDKSAEKKILIVRDARGMKTLTGIVRENLGISSNRDLNSEIADFLNELSVHWKIENIHEERKHAVIDIDHEADSILYQLKLDRSLRADVINIVKKEMHGSSGEYFFNAVYCDNAYIIN